MHTDGKYFQYFAVDFSEEPSALHASSILSQAAFVNEALHDIMLLYASSNATLGMVSL
jgi:hypothetical protein